MVMLHRLFPYILIYFVIEFYEIDVTIRFVVLLILHVIINEIVSWV